MAEKTATQPAINSPFSSPPVLTSTLNQLYQVLNDDMRRLFVRMYHYLWSYLMNKHSSVRRAGVLHCYWAIDILRNEHDLTTSQLALLSYLYQVSQKGTKHVHSNSLYYSAILPHLARSQYNGSMQVLIYYLIKRGYISRATRNPDEPYLSRSYSCRPVFVSLTSSGVQLIEGIERDLYKLLLNSSLNDITGVNKKP